MEKCPPSSSRHSCLVDDDCPFVLFFLFILAHKTPKAKRALGQSIQDGKQEGEEQLDRKGSLCVRGFV